MMAIFKKLSQIFALIPLSLLVYDLVKFWFVEAMVYVRSSEEVWKDHWPLTLPKAEKWFSMRVSPELWDKLMNAPAPLVLLIPPVVFYVIYRILFAINGGSGSGFRYKSRH